jgi:hypothetical protein
MSIETQMALLLRQMVNLHGSKSDWKGTPEWSAAAEIVEEEAEQALIKFANKYFPVEVQS